MNITRDIKKSFKPFLNSKPFKANQTQKLNIIRLPQNQDYKHDSSSFETNYEENITSEIIQINKERECFS